MFPSGAEVGLITRKVNGFDQFTDFVNLNKLRLLHLAHWKSLHIICSFSYQAFCFLNHCGITTIDKLGQVTYLITLPISREAK